MKRIMEKLETLLEWGGLKKEIILLVISGISLLLSLFHIPLPFSIAWVAIILCSVPIILEAIIGLVTALILAIFYALNELAMSIASGLLGYIGGTVKSAVHQKGEEKP